MRKTYLDKIPRIQMLIYPTLSPITCCNGSEKCSGKDSYKVHKNTVTKLQTFVGHRTFLSRIQRPNWTNMKDHRNQRMKKQDA